jgi:hypothetical protein
MWTTSSTKTSVACFLSFVEVRGKQNKVKQKCVHTTMGLDYEHMIKARAHKGGVRIGKTPKKLASIRCP